MGVTGPGPKASASSTEKSYGSNYFGEWVEDEYHNPAFRYTCNQHKDSKAETPVMKPGLLGSTEHIHQIGNDRLVAIASNHGYVQVRQDEGCPKFLNAHSPDRYQYGGGFGYLTHSQEPTMSTYYGESCDPDMCERIFGMGYYQKNVRGENISVRQVIQAPFGDDPVILSKVTVSNESDEPISGLRWTEYWGCHQYQFSFRLYMLAQAHGKSVMELRHQLGDRFEHHYRGIDDHRTGLINTQSYLGDENEENSAWEELKPILAANPTMFAGGAVSEPADDRVAFDDFNPPATFLASLDAPADAYSTNCTRFFGSGGPSDPSGLHRTLQDDTTDAGPGNAMLLQRELSLAVGESKTLYFLYGYNVQNSGSEILALVDKYRKVASTTCLDTARQWCSTGMQFEVGESNWISRETQWNYYSLRSALTFDSYFQEHILTQGAQYVYIMGNNSSARDPLQHVFPLIYTDPHIVREVLRYTLKMVRPDGSIPYGMVGHGMPMPTIMDDASDIPLFLLWLVSEYVLVTRDVDFLDEQIFTYPLYAKTKPQTTSALEIIQSVYRCMDRKVNVGEHGLFRQLQDDWNDAVITLWVPSDNRKECVRDGESVPNSAMAGVVFKHYARMLLYANSASNPHSIYSLDRLANDALANSETHRKAVTQTWTGRWFKRAWLGDATGWLGEKNIWLEPQPWALLADSADRSMAETLIESIDELLRQPSTLGAMQQNGEGERMADGGKRGPGMSVNGGIWPALNVTLTWALARAGRGQMAWDEWKRNSLARHAAVYPDVWYGTWSSLDSVNSALNERPGRASYSATFNQEDFPATNSHAHASQLTAIVKLLGIEFNPTGMEISPWITPVAYSFATAIVGVSKTSARIDGWYHPVVEGTWTVLVSCPSPQRAFIQAVEIQGKASKICWSREGELVIVGSSTKETRLEWSVKLRRPNL